MDTLIKLPYGGPGAGFYVSELIDHIRSTGRNYIIQGQQQCTLENHTKPRSLDVWLRRGFTDRKNVKQAVNEVVDDLVETGWFRVEYGLVCPDTGYLSKGLRLLERSEPKRTHMRDYRAIFDGVESTLISVGSRNLPEEKIRARLDKFKEFEGKTFTDAEYYWTLVCVIFYSGFRATTVSGKLDVIQGHFPDYETAAGYGDDEVSRILSDPEMIRNRRKVHACVDNARTFKSIVNQYGSFQGYIDSFSPAESFEDLMLLKEELEYRFKGLGRVTTYHFLTDIGLPVLKPDRVICRIFHRLGLIESKKQFLKAVIQGRKFGQATGHPIRYVDIVFVVYGQMESKEFGIERGICLEENPACSLCGVTSYCQYHA
jgi:DNA-3-methyladenine glycosylase I